MLRDAAISLIAQRLGNRTDLDGAITSEMDLVQSTALEQNGDFIPWFLLTEDAETTAIPTDQRLPLPCDFLMEYEEGALYVMDPDTGLYNELEKADYDSLSAVYKDAEDGIPVAYALRGVYFCLFPTPDLAYNIKMNYYSSDDAPSSIGGDGENSWLKYAADWLIEATTASVAGKYVREPVVAELANASANSAKMRVWKMHEARSATNRNYMMGDD